MSSGRKKVCTRTYMVIPKHCILLSVTQQFIDAAPIVTSKILIIFVKHQFSAVSPLEVLQDLDCTTGIYTVSLHFMMVYYYVCGSQIVVPKSLQQETLSKIHQGYQGIEKCHLRLSTSVWWPGVSREMQSFVQQCGICRQQNPHQKSL